MFSVESNSLWPISSPLFFSSASAATLKLLSAFFSSVITWRSFSRSSLLSLMPDLFRLLRLSLRRRGIRYWSRSWCVFCTRSTRRASDELLESPSESPGSGEHMRLVQERRHSTSFFWIFRFWDFYAKLGYCNQCPKNDRGKPSGCRIKLAQNFFRSLTVFYQCHFLNQ